MTLDPAQQNQFLHLILKEKCTARAFETVCDIITAVKGNPKMKALGESMKRRLETGCYVCVLGETVCVGTCGCVCVWKCCVQCTWMCALLNILANHCFAFYFATPLTSDLPSVPSSSSSQSRATTADKGPSPELESLPTTQQGMLHAVSLHTSAPHSVPSVGGVSVCDCMLVCWED